MNSLKGIITAINSHGHLWRVVVKVGTTEITAVLLDFAKSGAAPPPGEGVTILFKEAETALALDVPLHALSIRNRLPCRVAAVENDGLLANVSLDYEGSRLSALITSESAADLAIFPGKPVNLLIKSTEVMMERENV